MITGECQTVSIKQFFQEHNNITIVNFELAIVVTIYGALTTRLHCHKLIICIQPPTGCPEKSDRVNIAFLHNMLLFAEIIFNVKRYYELWLFENIFYKANSSTKNEKWRKNQPKTKKKYALAYCLWCTYLMCYCW